MKLLFSVILYFTTLNAIGQALDWVHSIGGIGYDFSSSVTVDDFGNVYSTGHFSKTVDFDPGTDTLHITSFGNTPAGDIYIQKLNPNGDLIWVKTVGSSQFEEGVSIKVDNFGNTYTIGNFSETADFDPGPGVFTLTPVSSQHDIFILKLDSNGMFLWAKGFGGDLWEQGISIAIGPSGAVYSTGYFSGTADFDPGLDTFNLIATNQINGFVQKLDSSGNFLWAKSMKGNGFSEGRALEVDEAENIYISGTYTDTVDFDPGVGTFDLVSNGGQDIFIQKLDSSGQLLWVKSIGSLGADFSFSIDIGQSSNIYITGSFQSTVDFDSGLGIFNLTAAGYSDMYIEKLDSSGNFIWVKSIGGQGEEHGTSIILDKFENIYTIGTFDYIVDFDPSNDSLIITAENARDNFIQKLDSSGNFFWAVQLGSHLYNYNSSIVVDANYNVYAGGRYLSASDFDVGPDTLILSSVDGGTDIFIIKLGQCGVPSFGIDTQIACDNYTWIDGNTYIANNNTATYVLESAVGCDSTITLDLIINSIDTSITQNINMLTANETGATYQWLDCNSNYSTISGQTNQSYNATTVGDYAVEIEKNGCIDTSMCFSVTTVGIIENDFGENLVMYPNPTNGNFKLDLGSKYVSVKISITDIGGKLVLMNTYLNSQLLDLNLEGPDGVYLLKIESEDKIATIRFIKSLSE